MAESSTYEYTLENALSPAKFARRDSLIPLNLRGISQYTVKINISRAQFVRNCSQGVIT
jgi:hypothetical protein